MGPAGQTSHAGGSRPGKPASGSALDAAKSVLESVASEARRAAVGRPDPLVSVAFSLGWQMAELYRPERRRNQPPAAEADLPGLARLTASEWMRIGLDQLQVGITKLEWTILEAGLDIPDVRELRLELESAADHHARSLAIRAFHVELLATLTAADYRLGKAYDVGRALADTTRSPDDYRTELDPHRVATLAAWIRDLATALPAHAAHPVADSIEAWSCWVHGAGPARSASRGGAEPRGAAEARVPAAVRERAELEAQGRLWRSLLSGEKRPVDTLEILDYVGASERMLRRSGALALHFLKRYWWLAVIVLIVFGASVGLIVSGGLVGVAGGAGGLLASVGLSWKGVGASVGSAAAKAEEPLWEAQLDAAVYERITPQTIVDSRRAVKRGPDEPSLTAAARHAAAAAPAAAAGPNAPVDEPPPPGTDPREPVL